MNAFDFPLRKRYYLTHPWKWFKELAVNIKNSYMRIRYGWCYIDVWNFDTWFLDSAVPMLRYLAKNGSSYPGREPFETPEKWHQWLEHMADLLESGSEEWQDKQNEFDFDSDSKHYFERAKELSEQGMQNVQYALNEIGKYFYWIWD